MKLVNNIKEKYSALPIQLKGSVWFLICSILQKGILALCTIIFTRLLNTSEFGAYNVFNSWLGILTVIVTLDLFNAVYIQGLVKFEEEKNIYSSALQGLTLSLTLFWLVVYICFRQMWNGLFGLNTVQMVSMFAIIWSTSVFTFWSQAERVESRYKKLIVVTLLSSIVRPVVSIVFIILAEEKVSALIVGMAIVDVLFFTPLFVKQMNLGRVFCSPKIWRYALRFNIPLIPHYLSMTVLHNSDRIMIKKMVDSSKAGIYSVAYSSAEIMTIFNAAFIMTLEPWIYQKIKSKKVDEISKIAYPVFLVICTVNILLIALAPEIVRIFAPSEYYEAIYVVVPVALSVFFNFIYSFFAVFEFYYEKTYYVTLASLIGAALNIILNYIFINIFGYMAAGYTTLVCYIFFATFHYLFMNRIASKHFPGIKIYDLRVLLLISITFITTGFMFLLTYKYIFIRYALIVISIVFLLVFRNRIIGFIKQIMQIRKQNKEAI